MTKSKEQLLDIWFNIRSIGGWLRILEMSKDYDQEDLDYLEMIDDNRIQKDKEIEKFYWEVEVPKIKKQIEEFEKEFEPEFRKERRLEFLNDQITKLQKLEIEIWNSYQIAVENDLPYWFRQSILELKEPEKISKKIKSLRVETYILEHPKDISGLHRVTPEQIARALEYPFKDLIQLNKAGFALCPFHKEKIPSFYVKNNWAYCFGCGWHGTTIDFLKAKDNMSFKEAVRALQGRI